MSIVELDTNNFFVSPGTKSNSLCINVPGVILVFFKLNGCKGCEAFQLVYERLAHEIQYVQYGILNLSYYRDVAAKSESTTTQIKAVPAIILYSNKIPLARFTGNKDLASLKKFINDLVPRHNEQNFVPQQNIYGGYSNNNANNVRGPDIQNFPSQATRMVKEGNPTASSVHPSMQKQCDPDDEECLKIPDNIIPYNFPWESDMRKMNM